jgi:hypothetical protein
MGTTFTLGGILFTGDGVYQGYTYDRIDDWLKVEAPVEMVARPNAPGAYSPGQTYPEDLTISIEGQFFGVTEVAALEAREVLLGLYNDGLPIVMAVTNPLGTTTREVFVKAVKVPWTIHRQFKFTVDVVAEDPRRYGPTQSVTVGLAVAGSGLVWPESGLVWPVDWGTVASSDRGVVVNTGNAETVSRYTVTGGAMLEGFAIVNVDTGERLTYVGLVNNGDVIELDTEARTAFINGTSPGGRFLPSPQWWAIPRKSTRVLQFIALGAVTGTPRLTIDTAPAYY